MTPDDAACALLDHLGLPDGAASVMVWYEQSPPSLRVWVDERYLWPLKQSAPKTFSGYAVDVEPRPIISAH